VRTETPTNRLAEQRLILPIQKLTSPLRSITIITIFLLKLSTPNFETVYVTLLKEIKSQRGLASFHTLSNSFVWGQGNNHGFGNEILHGVEVENGSILASENNVEVTVFDHDIDSYCCYKWSKHKCNLEKENDNGIILTDTSIYN